MYGHGKSIYYILLIVALGCAQEDTVIRNTNSGKVKGYVVNATGYFQVERFWGIPFAAPPTGRLRWQPPQRHPGWANTEKEPLDAGNRGPICPQTPYAPPFIVNGDEDCLFLDVYVPYKKAAEPFSVMLFIYGGYFWRGDSAFCDGAILSAVNDVIVVTPNYRLGSLGFLSTGDSQSPGNYGLLDQVAALEWVQENIEYFGGDKERVTIFGESAGAAAVLVHAISPMNNRPNHPQLFKRVIAQSGTPLAMWAYMSEPSYYAEKLMKDAGCPTFSSSLGIQCLREQNFSRIVELQAPGSESDPPWLPAKDGVFLTGNPASMVSSEELKAQIRGRYDYLIGVNDFDTTADVIAMAALQSEEEFTDFLETFMALYFEQADKITEATKHEYIDWFDYPPPSEKWKYLAAEATRDMLMVAPSRNFSNLASTTEGFNSSVFFYYFIQEPSDAIFKGAFAFPRSSPIYSWINGALHAEELAFVFGAPLNLDNATEDEKSLSRQVMTYWTNFAKTGNPNNGNPVQTQWPKYDSLTQQHIVLGSKEPAGNLTTLGSHLSADKVVFWTDELPLLDVGDGMDHSIHLPQPPAIESSDPVVDTDKGRVKGSHIITESYFMDRFLGIPFAEPPLGVLRFKPPVESKSWDGVLECDGNLTTQFVLEKACAAMDLRGGAIGTEDCLYLNIWVPGGVYGTRDRLLPVMVWIHGGTYANGSITGVSAFNDLEQLVAHGNIVGVGINYRTGPLGFLSTGDENAPGNLGYLDQVAALRWIKANIVNFGGDPQQVTLFGQGGGAASVSYHMVSPVSSSLFLRGIAESGVTPAQQTWQRDPLYWAQKLAGNVGCITQDPKLLVGCLRNKPMEDIVTAVLWDPLDHGGYIYNPWTAVVDGHFLVKDPISSLGDSADKDFLLGHNDMDGHVFASVDFPQINSADSMSRKDIELASTRFAPHVPAYVANSVAFKYIDWDEKDSGDWPKLNIVNLYTDSMFAAAAYWTANERLSSNGTGRTYVYRFTSTGTTENVSAVSGATYGDELPYVFGQPMKNSSSTPEERQLSLAVMTYWTNFAWSGDPNTPNSADIPTEWPEYTQERKQAMDISADSSILNNYRGEFAQFWSDTTSSIWSLDLVSCNDSNDPSTSDSFKSNLPFEARQTLMANCPDLPLVRSTEYGCVEGYVQMASGIAVERYLGIPYAAPPVGKARFTPPLPATSWNSIRPAKNFSKICPQHSKFDDATMSEDCLYLCVYVPRKHQLEEEANLSLAVMFWVHGGAYSFGDGMATSEGETLAALGHVLVVAMNYRVGSFGFMTTDDESSPGNYGLLDQQLAIKWTKDNIAAFGGDPENITIFGESAGAQSVLFHTLSPTNDVYGIRRALMESPTIVSRGDLKQLEAAIKLAETANCDINSGTKVMVECLKGLDVADLLHAQSRSGMSFLPTVDGTFLPIHPRQLVYENRVRKWTYLMGVNSGEGSVRWGDVQKVKDEESFHGVVQSFESDYGWRTKLIEQQYADYDDTDFFQSEQKMQIHATQMFGDERYVTPTLQLADDYTKIGSEVFMYYFTYPHQRPDFYGFPAWAGAAHSADLSFVFGDVINDGTESDDVKDLSRAIIEYWSNFARTGDPNRGQSATVLPVWPSFEGSGTSNGLYMQLDLGNKTVASENLRPTENAFWNDLLVEESQYCEDTPVAVTTTSSPSVDPNFPEIETDEGLVRGRRVTNDLFDVETYLGIPYAKPPVGDLRFEKTQKIQGWTTPLDATSPKQPCLQYFDGNLIGAEDCLYIDVFKPYGVLKSYETLMPVLMWIHGDAGNSEILGGGFWSGGGSRSLAISSGFIDPSYLANFGNVIVVRPNFRLGSLGFLTAENNVITGNYGLYDLKEALLWTGRNARNFGGDAERITLIGQGSGAVAAELLGILPATRGLVKRVISMSGSVYAPWVFCEQGNCNATTATITTSTGCDLADDNSMLECLKQTDPTAIVNSVPFVPIQPSESESWINYNAWGMWRIRKDGDLVPDVDLDELFSTSEVDLVSGTAIHEFYDYVQAVYGKPYSTGVSRMDSQSILDKAIHETDRFIYGSNAMSWAEEAYSTLIHSYRNWDEPSDEDADFKSAVKYYSDPMFAVSSSKSIKAKTTSRSGKAYQYLLSRSPDISLPSWVGARHGDDVIYTFGIPFTSPSQYSDDDRDFSVVFMSYWINFAWTGDPNSALSENYWMEYTSEAKHYLNMGYSEETNGSSATNFNAEKNSLWKDVIPLFAPETMPTTAYTTSPDITTATVEECIATVPPIGEGLGLSLAPAEANVAIYTMFSLCLVFGITLVGILALWMFMRCRKDKAVDGRYLPTIESEENKYASRKELSQL